MTNVYEKYFTNHYSGRFNAPLPPMRQVSRTQALSVSCPRCEVGPGIKCHDTLSGKEETNRVHRARVYVALGTVEDSEADAW